MDDMEATVRSSLADALGALKGDFAPARLQIIRSLALGLRLRTGLVNPFMNPRDLAFADGFVTEPSAEPLSGQTPWATCNAALLRYYRAPDVRWRGLFVAHALATGLYIRDRLASDPADRWLLATELLFPHAFVAYGWRLVGVQQRHAPLWLAAMVTGHTSGVFRSPATMAS